MRTIAAFDFDGTLTIRDSLYDFMRYANGNVRFSLDILKTLPALVLAKTRQEVKETFLTTSLGGKSYSYCKTLGENFSKTTLNRLLKEEGMKKLLWHQAEGHETVLVSANFDLYLKPWGQSHHLTDVLCSEVEEKDEVVTGKIKGLNCWGEEKVHRLLHYAGGKKDFILWAYGDTKGDIPLLKLADYPHYRHF